MSRLKSPAPEASRATCDEAALVALLGRIRFGDASALGQLYDLTVGRLHALALRVLGNADDAEEALSDVYLQVWERAASYCPERGAVMAWLQTLAWSRACDLGRARRRRQPRGLHPDDTPLAYVESEEPGPQLLAERAGAGARVQAALAGLGAAQRRVLELAYGEEMSHAKIAEVTGLPLGTVKSHAHRGLAALRAALDDLEGLA